MAPYPSACGSVSHLLDMRYFFATSLCALLIMITFILAALLTEQTINIAKNITTNERLNQSRYPWMSDSLGQPFNHFDRGILKNILEFWCFPGFERDYYSEFNWLSLRDTKMSTAEKVEAAAATATGMVGKTKCTDARDSLRNHISGIQQNNQIINRQNTSQNTSHSNSNESGEGSPPLQHASVAYSNQYGSPFRELLSVDQEQSLQSQLGSIPRFKLLPNRSSAIQSQSPSSSHLLTHSPSPSPSLSQTDLSQSAPLIGLPHGHMHYTVLTRAQEAQMQFEMRVQQAIDMSNLPRDANAVRTSRGMGQSDQLAHHTGYAPYIDADRGPSGSTSDWNMYAKLISSSQRDITGPSISEGVYCNDSQGFVRPPTIPVVSPNDIPSSPSPKMFAATPQYKSRGEGTVESKMENEWTVGNSMTVSFREGRDVNDGNLISPTTYREDRPQFQSTSSSPDRPQTLRTCPMGDMDYPPVP